MLNRNDSQHQHTQPQVIHPHMLLFVICTD